MSSPAVWAPIVLLLVLVGFILNLLRPMAVQAYRRMVRSNYDRRLSVWTARHDWLEELANIAKTAEPSAGDGALQLARAGFSYNLKRGEAIYWTFPATMVERRTRQNVPTLVELVSGTAAITNLRLMFEGGGTRREWIYDKLNAHEALGANVTLYGVTSRKPCPASSTATPSAHGSIWPWRSTSFRANETAS